MIVCLLAHQVKLLSVSSIKLIYQYYGIMI
jgi:hypothetical protein